jgi:hypothetical protein
VGPTGDMSLGPRFRRSGQSFSDLTAKNIRLMKIYAPLSKWIACLVLVIGVVIIVSNRVPILSLRESGEYLDPRGLVLTNSIIAVGKQKIDEQDAKEVVKWALSKFDLAKECEMGFYFSDEKWRAVVFPLDTNSKPVYCRVLYVTISKDGRELSILGGH